MESGASLSDRIGAFFYSADEQLIAEETIKFMQRDLKKRKKSEGYVGPKRHQIIRVVQRVIDEKYGKCFGDEQIESVIDELESGDPRAINTKDLEKVNSNKRYSLSRSYRDMS